MEQPIRVAIVAPEGLAIPPVNGGSVQIYLFHLLTNLSKYQYSNVYPTLLSPTIHNSKSLPFTIKKIHQIKKGPYLREALTKLRPLKTDIIQIDNRPAWVHIIKKYHPNTPIILNLHSVTFLAKSHLSTASLKRVWQEISAVVVNSHALARVLQHRYHAPKRKIHVIYPGVDLKQFPSRHSQAGASRRQRFRKRFNCENSFVFLYTGRIIRGKGVHTALQAFQNIQKTHRATHLFIVGNTHPWERQYRKSLERKVKNSHVKFVRHLPHSKLVDYYLGADAFLCPSQQFEAFGLVNVEALATGLPVIGSRQGGIAEIVTKKCGTLVASYHSEKSFRNAMLEAIQNQTHWQTEKSIQARQRAESSFSWKKTASGFANLYLLLAHRYLNSRS